MDIPVGAFLRSIVKGGFWRKVLDAVKGLRINVGSNTVVLNERPTVSGPGQSPLDSTPHKPGPIVFQGPRR